MELKLKHLTPYLPYGIRFNGLRNGWANPDVNYNLCLIDLVEDKYEWIKPILRPLRDITKDEFNDVYDSLCYTSKQLIFRNDLESDWVLSFRYYDFDIMLENHFDVFGLIEKGLAIDKNTL